MRRIDQDFRTGSFISGLQHASRVVRGIAWTVIVTFLAWQLSPTVLAAQTLMHTKAQTSASADNEEAKFARTLEQIERKIEQALEKLERNEGATSDLTEIKTLDNTVRQLDHAIDQRFGQLRQWIEQKHLGAEILQRHEEAITHYQHERDTLFSNLTALAQANDPDTQKQRLRQVHDHLKAQKNRRTTQPFNPQDLPFSTPTGKVRPPLEDSAQFQALLNEASGSKTKVMSALTTRTGPQPADLAPTEDAQITPEIQALAQSLNNSPVEIYKWVRNQIDFIPTYGSLQGAQMTLDAKRGNAFDTASLLVALLRAAKIPARYVYGTVQIPIEQVMNWVGGVKTPQMAMDLLGQGGIPNTGVIQGGAIKFIKIEHIWVEAWVDFEPSRGAIHREGDSWISMDPSFKQHQINQGLNIYENSFFSNQDALTTFYQKITNNPSDGWVQGFDDTKVREILGRFEKEFDTYLTHENLFTHQILEAKDNPLLAASVPYVIVASGNRYAELPSNFKQKAHFGMNRTN